MSGRVPPDRAVPFGEYLAGARLVAVADDFQDQALAQRQAVAQGRQLAQLSTQCRTQRCGDGAR
ncbi:hypothetical protein AN920_12925 [Pseudomonas paraeruginosa]|nr:hypothetical protein AN920_12925 [Pseudomonas paraeruginosa]